MDHVTAIGLALLLDAAFGAAPAIWDRAPHPENLIARAVAFLDDLLNSGGDRVAKGVIAAVLLLFGAAIIGWLIAILPDWGVLEALGLAALMGMRRLSEEVRAVAAGLRSSLTEGRGMAEWLTARDVAHLDEAGVCRGAIEGAARGMADRVVAPVFWFLLLGLPGALAFKAIDVADSMIGRQDARYGDFGWGVARLDDALNWLPARLAGWLIALAALPRRVWDGMMEDAPLRRAVNAGWPEAAMAYAIDLALAGPRQTEDGTDDSPWLNRHGRRGALPGDIEAAVRMCWRAWGVLTLVFVVLALIVNFA